ncbi:MAG: outer membrane beta-barrel protein [Elusimicrobiota bacterium]
MSGPASVARRLLFVGLLAAVLGPLAGSARAAVSRGMHVGGFANGANWGVGRLGRITDTGINFALLYRYHITGALSAGMEVRRIDYGATAASGTESDVELDSYALIGRWDVLPKSDLRPHLVCGVSSNRFKRKVVLGRSTSESSSYKPGGSVAIGLDRDFGKGWTVGGQFRYLHVGSDINALGLRLVISFRFA